jgi:hypothetical protein
MSDYYKVGISQTLYIYHQNSSTGAPITGAVAGDFTIQLVKNGTGNQSTTGIVGPTEVDASNNPGVYKIVCSGTTSFLSVTGTYELKVYLTANSAYVWNESFIVNNTGTGAGTLGTVSFTAVASNGRVVVGGVALAGATVLVLTPAGAIYTSTVSDASGLWGPIYFDTDGTYPVYVFKTGYSTTNSTIVISGTATIATGPGADMSIALVSAASTILVSTLQSFVRRIMLDASGTKSDTIILEIINEAAERIFMETQSPYWQKVGAIDLLAPYSTGTLTLTNASATVTFSGSSIPSWVDAGCDIFIPSLGSWYRISTNDSSSQVTIAYTYNGTTTAGLAFSISKVRYQLPVGCARTNDLMFGTLWPYITRMTSAAKLEMLKDTWQSTNAVAMVWAIEKDYICVWPPPSQAQHVNFLYFGKPAQVTTGSDTLDFPAEQVLWLRAALVLGAAERGSTVIGTVEAARTSYKEAKAIALQWDKTTAQTEPEGDNGLFSGDGYANWAGSVTTI